MSEAATHRHRRRCRDTSAPKTLLQDSFHFPSIIAEQAACSSRMTFSPGSYVESFSSPAAPRPNQAPASIQGQRNQMRCDSRFRGQFEVHRGHDASISTSRAVREAVAQCRHDTIEFVVHHRRRESGHRQSLRCEPSMKLLDQSPATHGERHFVPTDRRRDARRTWAEASLSPRSTIDNRIRRHAENRC